jgi:hypothetical protein
MKLIIQFPAIYSYLHLTDANTFLSTLISDTASLRSSLNATAIAPSYSSSSSSSTSNSCLSLLLLLPLLIFFLILRKYKQGLDIKTCSFKAQGVPNVHFYTKLQAKLNICDSQNFIF